MRLDLHIHSTASDGSWDPARVAQGAAAGRLDVIALADHDTTSGVSTAAAAAAALGVAVVPAVELSTTARGRDLHILGYLVDPAAPALRAYEQRARSRRLRRMEVMVGRLRQAGLSVDMDAVLRAAGGRAAVLGRPHLARALVEAGYSSTVGEAFDRFIGDQHAAFEPTALMDPAAGVELARTAGGIAVWAHPPPDLLTAMLPELVRAGLRGLEVYRPGAPPEQARRLAAVARTAGLLVTGGSDWHSPERNQPLGSFCVTSQQVAGFVSAAGLG